MAPERVQRFVGYSRLMGKNEANALAALDEAYPIDLPVSLTERGG